MRTLALILAGALLAAPALAFDNTNVNQPERLTTQSGQTSGGPIDTPPLSGGSADVLYGRPPVAVDGPVVVGPGVVEAGPGVIVVPAR